MITGRTIWLGDPRHNARVLPRARGECCGLAFLFEEYSQLTSSSGGQSLEFVVAADPRLDEAELVTMVGCSGPSFTNDCLRDSRGNHVAPETRLRTFLGRVAVAKHLNLAWRPCSLLEVAVAKQMSAVRCAHIHVQMAWLLLEDGDQLVAHTRDWS